MVAFQAQPAGANGRAPRWRSQLPGHEVVGLQDARGPARSSDLRSCASSDFQPAPDDPKRFPITVNFRRRLGPPLSSHGMGQGGGPRLRKVRADAVWPCLLRRGPDLAHAVIVRQRRLHPYAPRSAAWKSTSDSGASSPSAVLRVQARLEALDGRVLVLVVVVHVQSRVGHAAAASCSTCRLFSLSKSGWAAGPRAGPRDERLAALTNARGRRPPTRGSTPGRRAVGGPHVGARLSR